MPAATAIDTSTDWNSLERLNFTVAGKPCFITRPAISAPGKPWVWRTSFPDYHAEVDLELLRHGWAVGYIECLDLLGCDAVTRYLQQRFPDTKFDFIAAGIPSLGSVPHAFRLETDVLARGPLDLLFVEAAVNDHNHDGQPLQHRPRPCRP